MHATLTKHTEINSWVLRMLATKKSAPKILKVRKRDVKDRDTGTLKKKIIIFFENIDKPLILNVTNKNLLVEALGKTRPVGKMPLSEFTSIRL